ncbi:hypothetical protein GQ473_06630 [archaeon]|nr:hypothetical protein [archaeon]
MPIYAAYKIKEYVADQDTYYEINGTGTMITNITNRDPYNMNTVQTTIYKTNESFSEPTNGTYSFLADLTGNTRVLFPYSVNNILYSYEIVDPPNIFFVPPTPVNDSITNNTHSYVNVTINDTSFGVNSTAFIDWDNSLVGWWRFNNEAEENSTFFKDWSSYGNNGTCTNCPTAVAGKFNGALEFDGIDDFVGISNSNNLKISGPITIMAWVYVDSVYGDGSRIIDKISSGANEGYALSLANPTTVIANFAGLSDWSVTATTANMISKWSYITGTYNNSDICIYVNGENKNCESSTGSISIGDDNIYVGDAVNYIRPFNGTIDEVKIWNRALSEQEIKASYDAGLYRLEANFTNLADKTYKYTAYVQDELGNINQTETREIAIDAIAPIITIEYPADELHSKDTWLNISVDQRVSNCIYSLDGAENITMQNDTRTHYHFLAFNIPEGQHTVNYWCTNYFGLSSFATKNFNLTPGFTVIKLTGTGFSPTQDSTNKYVSTSFADGTTTAIVHADGIFEGLSSGTTHIALNQKTLLHGNTSKAYIVYTKGDTDTIENRISKITNGNINHMPNPSFSFGINKKYNIQVGLEYDNINFNTEERIKEGQHRIVINNLGEDILNNHIIDVWLK